MQTRPHGRPHAQTSGACKMSFPADTLYHLVPKESWSATRAAGKAYYPPTYEQVTDP